MDTNTNSIVGTTSATQSVVNNSMKIPMTLLGDSTIDPFPCIENIIDLYHKKNIKTIFASIGTSKSCISDLEICETLGCPIFVVDTSDEDWTNVEKYIKENSSSEEKSSPDDLFLKGINDKWILPKQIHIQSSIPWWTTGTMNIDDKTMKTTAFMKWVQKICSTVNINEVRLDIIKIDLPNDLEHGVIGAMLDAGFRPSLVLVNWSHSPDSDVSTSLSAGHLQNCGYNLMGIEGAKCVYYYSNQDLYMLTSWEDITVPNPLVAELFKSFRNSQKQLEGGNARNLSKPLPSDRETITSTIS